MKFKNLVKEILVEKRSGVITEADRRSVIQSALGFSEAWANEFHNMSEKYSVWIANSFKALVKDQLSGSDRDEMMDTLNKFGPGKVTMWGSQHRSNFEYILDWLTSPRRRENVNLKDLTFSNALEKSREWHQSLESSESSNYKEENEILIDYRTNGVGYYWVNLNTSYSQEEADRMGHCGRDSGTTLFSLRSINQYGDGRSHITSSYNLTDHKINQTKGKKNSKPKSEYYGYIVDLILNTKYPVKGFHRNSYGAENNFKLSDLDTDTLNSVLSKNRDLKIDYFFGDKRKLYTDFNDENIVMFREDLRSDEGKYGIINIESMEIIKDYEYEVDELSDYTEFLPYHDQIALMKEFKNVNSPDSFILFIIERRFKMISKEDAIKELQKNDQFVQDKKKGDN
jgi:hypothetical protein